MFFFLLVGGGFFFLSFKTTVYDDSRDKDEVICGDVIFKKARLRPSEDTRRSQISVGANEFTDTHLFLCSRRLCLERNAVMSFLFFLPGLDDSTMLHLCMCVPACTFTEGEGGEVESQRKRPEREKERGT